jgi:hypothetical protein
MEIDTFRDFYTGQQISSVEIYILQKRPISIRQYYFESVSLCRFGLHIVVSCFFNFLQEYSDYRTNIGKAFLWDGVGIPVVYTQVSFVYLQHDIINIIIEQLPCTRVIGRFNLYPVAQPTSLFESSFRTVSLK